MAKNQLYPQARHIAVTAPFDIDSGDAVIIGGLAGVAQTSAGEGETVTLWLDGSYEFPVFGGTPKAGEIVCIYVGEELDDDGNYFGSFKQKYLSVGEGRSFGVVITADQAAGTAEVVPLGAHNPAVYTKSEASEEHND